MRLPSIFRTGITLFAMAAFSAPSFSQAPTVQQINKIVTPGTALAPLHFLAADELMGRGSMRPEIHIAARYISESFRRLNLKAPAGTTDYFQTFSLQTMQSPTAGSLTINGKAFQMGTDLLQSAGRDTTLTATAVYVTKESLPNTDVKGKLVISDDNLSNSLLQEKGALAKITRFKKGNTPWNEYQQFFAGERPVTTTFPSFIVNDEGGALPSGVSASPVQVTITSRGGMVKNVPMKNVIGWVEGTDPKLKSQFVVLTAHYDHVGVAKQPKMVDGKPDSIYNGARDNAVGVAAVMSAAEYFAQHPPKRSVLFIAYAGEESGMLGSKHFAQNPVVPLRQLVYNLNIDNAGYNDTTVVTVVGLGRTSADANIQKAAAAYGLTAIPDPAPEQNLFDRSDNVSLAVKGVPAPSYSLGFRKFDEELGKYYHQVADEVSTMSPGYTMKYIRSFVLAAKYIADDKEQPIWQKGDKYEAAWKTLYQ